MSSDTRSAMRHPERHRAEGKVVVGWCHPGHVSTLFMESVFSAFMVDAARGPDARMLAKGGGFVSISSGPRIVHARTEIIETFLKVEEADWLWMLDTDMSFEPDTLERLLNVAHPIMRPIVGGLCFAVGHTGTVWPTIYELVQEDNGHPGAQRVLDYPRDSLVRVGGTGAACLLMHRSALLMMAQPSPKGFGTFPDGTPNPHPWFVEGINAGQPFGEDIAFCMRANACKIPIHVDTRIKVGHVKPHVVDEESYLAGRPSMKFEPTELTIADPEPVSA